MSHPSDIEAVIEPDEHGRWFSPSDDSGDGPRVVRLDSNMGMPHMNLELINCDGLSSPAAARALAYRLLLSALYAESCVLVDGPHLSVVR